MYTFKKTSVRNVARQVSVVSLAVAVSFPTISHAGWFDRSPAKKVVAKVVSAPARVSSQPADLLQELRNLQDEIKGSQPINNVLKDGKIINDVQDVMVFLEHSRKKYEHYASTEDQHFRDDIHGMLYNVADLSDIMHLKNIGGQQRIDKARDLVNRTPAQLMYMMHVAFGPAVNDINDQLVELNQRLDFMRDIPAPRELLASPEDYRAQLCPLVSDREVNIGYVIAKNSVSGLKVLAGYVNDMTPDDLNVTAVAVGGAGLTLTKYPAKYITTTLKAILEGVELGLTSTMEIATAICVEK